MGKVWCVSRYGNPIDTARRFGELVEITVGPINPFAVDRLAYTLGPSLNQFDPDNDYFMLTGPGSAYMVAGVMLFSKFERINCLRYESTVRDYLPVEVTRPKLEQKMLPSIVPPGRIFVLNYSGHSIGSALEFSTLPKEDKLVLLTRGNVDQFDTEGITRQLLGDENNIGLLHYQPGDMLLISGPGLLHMLSAACFVEMGKNMSLLLFNPKQRNYVPRDVGLRNVVETEKLSVESAA
jgi:hypothetical protein